MSIDPKSTYYDAGGIETLEVIRAKLTPEQYTGYCLGNTIKYICRANFKHTKTLTWKDRVLSIFGVKKKGKICTRDLDKALTYLSQIGGAYKK